jgi:hypothetical protein
MSADILYILYAIIGGVMSVAALLGYTKVAKRLHDRKRYQLDQLREYHARLKIVLSELLAKANEVDQQAKYLGESAHRHTEELKNACDRLLALTDALPVIEKTLDEKNLTASRQMLHESTNIAHHVSTQLDALLQSEHKLITRKDKGDEKV